MKFLPLIVANLLRRKTRSLLSLLSFVVALFLFGILHTISSAFSSGVEAAGADRLVIINKVSLIQPLPMSYGPKIEQLPGIRKVTYANWFGGVYQDEKNFFAQFAVDHNTWRDTYPNFIVPDDQWANFAAHRTACIAGEGLMKRFGWKLGDRIPIQGAIFPGTWGFDLVGVYHGERPQDDVNQFWFRADYLEENGPPWHKGFVGWYVARVDPHVDLAGLSKQIDALFANSTWETRAQSEQFFMASFANQIGNISFLMTSIGSVVFFTLLLVTGNTMAMSVRERTADLAVLKAIGFADGFILGLVLLESMLIAMVGGGIGLAAAKAFTLQGDPTHLLPGFYLSPAGLATGAFVTIVVGFLAGLLPALSAMRLQVVAALRRL